jgi:hypothetical protein
MEELQNISQVFIYYQICTDVLNHVLNLMSELSFDDIVISLLFVFC